MGYNPAPGTAPAAGALLGFPGGCCCSPMSPQPITRSLPDEAGVPLQLQDKLGGALGAGVQQDLQHLPRGTRTSHSCPPWSRGVSIPSPPQCCQHEPTFNLTWQELLCSRVRRCSSRHWLLPGDSWEISRDGLGIQPGSVGSSSSPIARDSAPPQGPSQCPQSHGCPQPAPQASDTHHGLEQPRGAPSVPGSLPSPGEPPALALPWLPEGYWRSPRTGTRGRACRRRPCPAATPAAGGGGGSVRGDGPTPAAGGGDRTEAPGQARPRCEAAVEARGGWCSDDVAGVQ